MRSEMNETFALKHFTDVEFWKHEYVRMVDGGCVCILDSGHHIRKIESAYVYTTIHFEWKKFALMKMAQALKLPIAMQKPFSIDDVI